nr:PREDICTED: exocyst complex component 1-like [Anolis carolinensis]|eukprot:XP_016849678.1 PREDICTED: exocyst complex component 1-like [Anolis carolinensis]
MSSLVKEDLNKKLFKSLGQSLHEFIEVECSGQDRFYLCASGKHDRDYIQPLGFNSGVLKCLRARNSCNPFCLAVTKGEEVQISMVKHFRIGLDEKYEISEKWFLDDLEMIDGKEADTVSPAFHYKACFFCNLCYYKLDDVDKILGKDNPWFDMHFKKVYSWEAYSCASKYAFARTLNKLNEMYLHKDLKIVNFDFTYINEEALWSSSNGDCVVLMRICFYASNLLCLSLCPLPG